jgi:hypothetical protein
LIFLQRDICEEISFPSGKGFHQFLSELEYAVSPPLCSKCGWLKCSCTKGITSHTCYHKLVLCYLFDRLQIYRAFQNVSWESLGTQCFSSPLLPVNLYFISGSTYSFSMWNCNILKLMPKFSPRFSCRTMFHIDIVHEHPLFQCISHMWHFNTGNNTNEWLLIIQLNYSSGVNARWVPGGMNGPTYNAYVDFMATLTRKLTDLKRTLV